MLKSSNCGASLRNLVHKMLKIDPKTRLSTISDVLKHKFFIASPDARSQSQASVGK